MQAGRHRSRPAGGAAGEAAVRGGARGGAGGARVGARSRVRGRGRVGGRSPCGKGRPSGRWSQRPSTNRGWDRGWGWSPGFPWCRPVPPRRWRRVAAARGRPGDAGQPPGHGTGRTGTAVRRVARLRRPAGRAAAARARAGGSRGREEPEGRGKVNGEPRISGTGRLISLVAWTLLLLGLWLWGRALTDDGLTGTVSGGPQGLVSRRQQHPAAARGRAVAGRARAAARGGDRRRSACGPGSGWSAGWTRRGGVGAAVVRHAGAGRLVRGRADAGGGPGPRCWSAMWTAEKEPAVFYALRHRAGPAARCG